MKRAAFIGLFAMIIAGAGCFSGGAENQDNQKTISAIDRDAILFEARKSGLIMDEEETARMAQVKVVDDPTGFFVQDVDKYLEMDFKKWPAAALADVTAGESYGMAHARFVDNKFTFVAKLGNLPEPAEGYFYHGWLVDRGNEMKMVDVGTAVKTQEGYANVYISSEDLSKFAFYVLTLEPSDGNAQPSEHILEGAIK